MRNTIIPNTVRLSAMLTAAAAFPAVAQDVVVETFDDHTAFGIGKLSSSDPALTVGTVTTEPFEGTGALALEYNFIADESWGGAVEVRGPGTGFDFSGSAGLSLRFRVLQPVSPTDYVTLIFKLVDESTAGTATPQVEFWEFRTTDVLGDTTGEWQELLIPFDEFLIPDWITNRGDDTLNLDAITNWQIQVIAEGNGVGSTYTGAVHFDSLTLYDSGGGDGDPIDDALAFFEVADDPEGDFWIEATSLGWIYAENYPWFYSYSELGWLYSYQSGATFSQGSWFWDVNREDWIHTNSTVYPWVYTSTQGWIISSAE